MKNRNLIGTVLSNCQGWANNYFQGGWIETIALLRHMRTYRHIYRYMLHVYQFVIRSLVIEINPIKPEFTESIMQTSSTISRECSAEGNHVILFECFNEYVRS